MSVAYIYVPFPCNLFCGLSLALRSHDQFQASIGQPSFPPPPFSPDYKKKLYLAKRPFGGGKGGRKKVIGATLRIGQEILCLTYAVFCLSTFAEPPPPLRLSTLIKINYIFLLPLFIFLNFSLICNSQIYAN